MNIGLHQRNLYVSLMNSAKKDFELHGDEVAKMEGKLCEQSQKLLETLDIVIACPTCLGGENNCKYSLQNFTKQNPNIKFYLISTNRINIIGEKIILLDRIEAKRFFQNPVYHLGITKDENWKARL